MSATQFVEAVAIFQGAQGKFYLVDGEKYHIRFPIDWAHNHLSFGIVVHNDEMIDDSCGPKICVNCKLQGSIRGVFVGYCCNCLLKLSENGESRGNPVALGYPIDYLENKSLWHKYPYMYGVKKTEIGDKEEADVRDKGIDLERLIVAIEQTNDDIDEDIDEDKETEYSDIRDDISMFSDDASTNSYLNHAVYH